MALNLRCGTAGVNEFSATIQTFGRAPWLANQASGDLDSGGAVSHLRHQGGSSSLSVDSGIAAMILGCVMQAILHSGGTGTRRSQTPSAAAWPRVSSVRRRTSHPSFRSVFLWPAAVAGGSGMAAPGAICPGQRHASAFGTKPRDFPARSTKCGRGRSAASQRSRRAGQCPARQGYSTCFSGRRRW